MAHTVETNACDVLVIGAGIAGCEAALSAAEAGARTESRGAHHRVDFPAEDPAQARPLVVRLGRDSRPVAEPLG